MDQRSPEFEIPDLGKLDTKQISESFDLIYDDLRRVASALMKHERVDHSWRTSDLMHECFMRIVNYGSDAKNVAQFRQHGRKLMRQLLIEHSRRKNRVKDFGGKRRHTLDTFLVKIESETVEMAQFNEARNDLELLHPKQAEILELEVVCGLSVPDIAAFMNLSEAAIYKNLRNARAFIHMRLKG